jgi:hypothetical protein
VIVGPRRQYRVGSIDGRLTATTWQLPTLAPERDASCAMLNSLGVPPIEAGGVRLYRLTPLALAPYRKLTALAMEQRAGRSRFEALLLAGEHNLERGGDLASLTPRHAQQLGLLPDGWFGGTLAGTLNSNPIFHADLVLGPAERGRIAVGVEGSYDALEPVAMSHAADASQVYFPYPVPLSHASASRGPAMMVMTFDRAVSRARRRGVSARRVARRDRLTSIEARMLLTVASFRYLSVRDARPDSGAIGGEGCSRAPFCD